MIDEAALRGPQAAETVGLRASTLLDSAVQQFAKAPENCRRSECRRWREVIETRRNPQRNLWLTLSSKADVAAKGDGDPAIEALVTKADTRKAFNGRFLTASDATDSSEVGVWGALKGSLLTIVVTMALAFPIGVFSALYLEEFAPRNRWTDLIEVSINNLAAVPSIILACWAWQCS